MDNKKTIFHHISLSKTSLNLTGGEKAELEIVDFLDKKGFKNIIYTSESGEILYKRLKNFNNVDFIKIGSFRYEKINPYLAYYLRFPQLFFHLRKFDRNCNNIIFTHDDFVPSTLYSFLLKIINPNSKWIFFYHMKSPSLFRGFLGEFTNKFHFPNLRLIRYWLGQRMSFSLTKKVDRVITVNPFYENYLLKWYNKQKLYIINKYSGVKIPLSITNTSHEKKYDLGFMGRFHEQKGVFEIPEILKKLKQHKKDIKLFIIGGGNQKLEKKFFKIIRDNNLEDNISFKGYITGDKKFYYLSKAKIFLFPSYYESFGQVALEAMKCGLPVVAYDLPVFDVLKKGMIKVPILNNSKMTEEILKLLNDDGYYKKISDEALKFSSEFSWEKTGEEVYNLIFNKKA